MADSKWPITIHAGDNIAAATMTYRRAGKLYATALVKATFGFVSGGVMSTYKPQAIASYDRFQANDRNRSVKTPSDLAPYRELVDVIVAGNAYAPKGARAQACTVQLLIERERQLVLNKSLLVQASVGADGQPEHFRRIAIEYERAAASPDNPVGMRAKTPNIVALGGRGQAGFGPIAAIWPARATLLGDFPVSRLAGSELELPEQFARAYFQCAPQDQQLEDLHVDEWVTLVGMSPNQLQLKTRLPGAFPLVTYQAPNTDRARDVHMHATLLNIDAERRTASVTWSGTVPLADPTALDQHRFDAALSFDLDAELEDDDLTATTEERKKPSLDALSETLSLDRTFDADGNPLPFDSRAGTAPKPLSARHKVQRSSGTIDETIEPPESVLPFKQKRGYKRVSELDLGTARRPEQDNLTGTMEEIAPEVIRKLRTTPFQKGQAKKPPQPAAEEHAPSSSGTIEVELSALLKSGGQIPFGEANTSQQADSGAKLSDLALQPPRSDPEASRQWEDVALDDTAPGISVFEDVAPAAPNDPLLQTAEAPASVVLRGMQVTPFSEGDAEIEPVALPETNELTGTIEFEGGLQALLATPFDATDEASSGRLKRGGLGEKLIELMKGRTLGTPKAPRKRRVRRRRTR